MRRSLFAALAALLLGTPCFAAGVDFVFDLQPGSILFSPDADGFKAFRQDSGYYWSSYESEEIEGIGSLVPTVRAGIGIDTDIVNIDFKAGGGYLFNGAFMGPILRGDVAFRFKLGNAVTLGPHIGVIHFYAPDWEGDADLDFSSATGVMGGLDFSAGKTISFLLSLDYVQAKFDVESRNGWYLDDEDNPKTKATLDMSGLVLQLGIVGRF